MTETGGGFSGGAQTSSMQLLVPGQPKPPLSLALLVNNKGSSILVPFDLEHVPVGGK